MSGIYIPGMEMPKAGNWKTIRIYYDGTCAVPNWQGDCTFMKGCEAIPVPDHGRLVDKDALEKDISESVVFSGRERNAELIGANKIINRLHRAPTIIPADKEGEG